MGCALLIVGNLLPSAIYTAQVFGDRLCTLRAHFEYLALVCVLKTTCSLGGKNKDLNESETLGGLYLMYTCFPLWVQWEGYHGEVYV